MNEFKVEYIRKSELKLENWKHLITVNSRQASDEDIKHSYSSHEEARKACEKVYKQYGGFHKYDEYLGLNEEYKYYFRTPNDPFIFRIKTSNVNWKIGFEKIMAKFGS